MVRRSGYPGVADAELRFENVRPAIVRLQGSGARPRRHHTLRRCPGARCRRHPPGGQPAHATAEFFGATRPADLARHARTVAEFDALRSTLADLRKMADAYHPATPEARSLNHAAMALRMAADVLTGRPDFFRVRSSDGSSSPMR